MRLGKLGSVVAFGFLAIVVLAILGALVTLALRSYRKRARRAEARRMAQADRDVPWTWFSRPNLGDKGRTWEVGVERRTEDDRVLSGPILVTDRPIPRDDMQARLDAEGTAMSWAEEWTSSGAR